MKPLACRLLLLLTVTLSPAPAHAIDVRLSIKFILDATGNRPTGTFSTDDSVRAAINSSNQALERWGRGYRYVITDISEVSGASQYFALDRSEFFALDDAAKADPARYYWRTDAVNVFVVQSAFAGGAAAIASNPFDAGHDLVMLTVGVTPVTNWLHELGHHFDLYHTFDDDHVSDTPYDPESTCTSPFSCSVGGGSECCCSTKLSLLSALSYSAEDNGSLLYNLMGYYGALDCPPYDPPFGFDSIVLTDGQLDRWTDATRRYPQLQGEVSGYTQFVDAAYLGLSDGYSTSPYRTVADGLAATRPSGDIVLIRSGRYPEPMTISKSVTLVASGGNAVLGS